MLRRWLLAGGIAISMFVRSALACDFPALPEIPGPSLDGPVVRQAAQLSMQNYFQAMDEYVACIKAELDAAGGDDAPQMLRAVLVQRNNLAVAEAQAVADWFETRFGTARAP